MKYDKVIAVRPNKTIYLDGDRVLKVFDADYKKSNVLNEALNHARVEETGLKVPKLLEATMIDGKWALVSEYIKGKTLAELAAAEPARKNEYIEQLVDLQLEVHAQKSNNLNKLRDKLYEKISIGSLDSAVCYELHTRLEAMRKHDKLCHGDFNMENIVITESGEAYILDWAHASQGNASADAAQTYMLFWLDGDFDSAKLYLELFCKKSNIARRLIEKWLPIVAAARLLLDKENEREVLLSWVNVTDFE